MHTGHTAQTWLSAQKTVTRVRNTDPTQTIQSIHISPSPVKSSALQRIVTFPGAGIEIVSRQSPTFQSGPSSPQLLLTTCVKQAHKYSVGGNVLSGG